MLIDLNVHWPQNSYTTNPTSSQIQQLKNTLITLEELGYTHVVLNFTLNHSDKVPTNNTNPIDLSLLSEFEDRLKLFTRCTIIIDEPSQGQSISKLQNAFDIVAALPVSEKGLLLACNSLDIDIVTFHFDKRLPTFLKHKTVGAAIKRGIKFEVTYSTYLNESGRAQFINNTLNVIRSTRNQNIVVSSGARTATELRSFGDIYNVFTLLGFKPSSENLVKDKAATVLLNGRLRNKSYKQTVMVGEDVVNETGETVNDYKRKVEDVNGGGAFKNQLKRLKK